MEMCLGARAGSHEMAEMTGQTRRVDEELGGTGMNAVREFKVSKLTMYIN